MLAFKFFIAIFVLFAFAKAQIDADTSVSVEDIGSVDARFIDGIHSDDPTPNLPGLSVAETVIQQLTGGK